MSFPTLVSPSPWQYFLAVQYIPGVSLHGHWLQRTNIRSFVPCLLIWSRKVRKLSVLLLLLLLLSTAPSFSAPPHLFFPFPSTFPNKVCSPSFPVFPPLPRQLVWQFWLIHKALEGEGERERQGTEKKSNSVGSWINSKSKKTTRVRSTYVGTPRFYLVKEKLFLTALLPLFKNAKIKITW